MLRLPTKSHGLEGEEMRRDAKNSSLPIMRLVAPVSQFRSERVIAGTGMVRALAAKASAGGGGPAADAILAAAFRRAASSAFLV
jgi:hypothetical protein